MATQQQPPAGKSALDALDRLQVSLRERRADLAEWEQAVRAERVGKGKAMNKEQALTLLRTHKAVLVQRFGVVDIALFGSTARDEATSDSDMDILIRFDGPATSKRCFGVQFYLEDLPGLPVDLITDKALRPELRPYVEREAIHV